MESIGERLRDARETQGVTISQAAAATRIKFQHIESMERDDFSNIAAAAYARGFLKIYAEFLGLVPDPLIREYNRHYAPAAQRGVYGDADEAGGEPTTREGGLTGEGGGPGAWPRAAVIGVAVVAVVALVLFIAGLLRGGGAEDGEAEAAVVIDEPLRIGDPPDPYLTMPNPDNRQP